MTAALFLHRKFKFATFVALAAALLTGTASMPTAQAAGSPLKITVYGGSGNIGQRIVKEALDRGHEVTVVARDPSRVTEKHARLKAVKGDILDSKAVAKQVAGQDVVVIAVSFRGANPDFAGYKKAAESYVSVARELKAKAPRLIVVGGAGSLEAKPGVLVAESVPDAFKGEVLGQKDALDYYRTVKDVSWTYFSPAGTIQPGKRTGKFRLGGDQLITDSSGKSVISMEDYAVALIDEAEAPKHVGKRFTIGY
jgi:putative NADH-flavin reductase